MRVGLAQIDPVLGDLPANVEAARAAVAQAVEGGADLVVLPELALSGYALGVLDAEVAVACDDPALLEVAAAAGDAAVVVGFAELLSGRRYNSAAYLQGGTLRHVHRKLFLPTYAAFEERKHFSPGPRLRAFDTPFGRAAMLICYDAWQPALAFLAIQDGAELLLVPTASPHSDLGELDVRDWWRDLTRLYARLFACHVVFVNRAGEEAGARYWGGSHVVDVRGEVVCEAPADSPAVVVSDPIDPSAVRERRRRLPLTREARLTLLRRELDRLIDEDGDL